MSVTGKVHTGCANSYGSQNVCMRNLLGNLQVPNVTCFMARRSQAVACCNCKHGSSQQTTAISHQVPTRCLPRLSPGRLLCAFLASSSVPRVLHCSAFSHCECSATKPPSFAAYGSACRNGHLLFEYITLLTNNTRNPLRP